MPQYGLTKPARNSATGAVMVLEAGLAKTGKLRPEVADANVP